MSAHLKALIIENWSGDPAGFAKDAATTNGFDIEVVRAYENEARDVDPRDFDAMIVLGGHMSAWETDEYRFLNDVTRVVQRAADTEVPVLAICLGAQIASMAFGGEAFLGKHGFENGWQSMVKTDAGKANELLDSFDDGAVFLEWHECSYTLPDGAQQLLSGQKYSQQAFELGSIFAVQFHPEITEPTLREWQQMALKRRSDVPHIDELLADFEVKAQPGRNLLNAFWKQVAAS